MTSVISRAKFKLEQLLAFARYTRTPFSLIFDSLKLKGRTFIAISNNGIKLRLRPRSGESFTFFENLVRRDYLSGGIKLSPGDTVFDVGANIGSFTVLAASIVGPHGRVVSFEPIKQTMRRLKTNIALNGFTNVLCIAEAVDAHDGELKLHNASKSALSTAYHLNIEDGEAADEVTVPTTTIRSAMRRHNIARINLLKIDCEGSEYGIFESMTAETAQTIDQIALEVHHVGGQSSDALAERIRQLGFEVHQRPLCWVAFNRQTDADYS